MVDTVLSSSKFTSLHFSKNMDFPINDNTDQKEAVLALTLQAAKYPLMRRVNQQFIVEDKLRAYEDEITRLGTLNKSALASIKNQEHRLKEIQSSLRRSKAPQQHQQQQNIDRNWEMKVPNQEKISFSTDNEVSTTTEFNQDSHEQHHTGPIITDASNQSTSTAHKEKSTQVCGSMVETHNVIVAEVSNNSFTLKWDVGNDRHNLDNIYDVEIRYSHTASGVDTSVHQRSCSRWVLKDPVPKHGKLVVDQLETDTEYRDVCLRFRSHLGWSEFTKPIKKICTSESGELIGGVSPVNAKPPSSLAIC
jgi:TolA-binding protein